MNVSSLSFLETFQSFTCSCGVTYALSNTFIKAKQAGNKSFYCPNGCNRIFTDTEASKLRAELRRKEVQLHAAQCEASRERNDKLAERRIKNAALRKLKRAEKGVCTCCNRTFTNLQRHMKTKHPEIK